MELYSEYLGLLKHDKDGCMYAIGEFEYKYNKDVCNRRLRNPVIHMYTFCDTTDEDGNLNGYGDSLFFTMVIYDQDTNEYCTLLMRDGIRFDNVMHDTRIFKDGSTMIMCLGQCTIIVNQEVFVKGL